MTTRRILWAIVTILVLLVVGYAGYRLLFSGTPQTTQQFSTAKVTKGTINSTLSATGIIISANQVDLDFDYPGELASLAVEVNSQVTAGQELATLEPTDTKIGEQTLTSPIDGTVIYIGAKVSEQIGTTSGTTSTPQTTTGMAQGGAGSSSVETSGFITVADLKNLQVKMGIDQADIAKVAVGQPAKITLDAIPDKEFAGNVVFIDPIPTSEQNVITYTVYATLGNPDPAIRLGMSADVKLDLGKKENVLIVPNLAVKTVEGKKVVSKIVDGVPTDVNVEVGLSDDENTEIVSGLLEGDKVTLGVVTITPQGGTQRAPMGGGGGMFGAR
ncbi:MAG: HlyD family efflux transporter periplasmic adaptor subunit [Actinomycetota bacterium]